MNFIASNKIVLILIAFFYLFWSPKSSLAVVDFDSVKRAYKPSDIVITDLNGTVINLHRTEFSYRRLWWTELKDISPVLIDILIRSEDKHFYHHSGVDWIAMTSAVVNNLLGRSIRGASTITMQLSNLIEGKGRNKSWKDKYHQILSAIDIEQSWTKGQILEAYLNLVSFKGEIQGIATASQILLDKSLSGINTVEAVILTVLINKPNSSLKGVINRSINLCSRLKLSCNERDIIDTAQRVFQNYIKPPEIVNPMATHIINHLQIGDSNKIVTTIDAKIQRFTIDTIKKNLLTLRQSNVYDCAVLIIENKTGKVIAYVANSGGLSSARFVDGIVARRQAGSTLKPFLYALAIEKGLLHPSSILDDYPVLINTTIGLYSPENYAVKYTGKVTLRQALGSSLNAPAVKTIDIVGVEEFYYQLKKLGFNLTNPPDFYGHSLSLGAIDVSLLELAQAYRVLALQGLYKPLVFQPQTRSDRAIRVFSPETSFVISQILSDRSARSLSFGLENPLSTRFWTAVKTGTSKDMRDNWCVGYSEHYTVAVWVGNFSGKPMWNVSGVSGSAQIWLEIMNFLNIKQPSNAPKVPQGVISKEIHIGKMTYEEFYLKRYFDADIEEGDLSRHVFRSAKFIYPQDGIFISIDPDIPIQNQKIPIHIKDYQGDLLIQIDDKTEQLSSDMLLWQPKIGGHKATLLDKNNKILDEITFFVK